MPEPKAPDEFTEDAIWAAPGAEERSDSEEDGLRRRLARVGAEALYGALPDYGAAEEVAMALSALCNQPGRLTGEANVVVMEFYTALYELHDEDIK